MLITTIIIINRSTHQSLFFSLANACLSKLDFYKKTNKNKYIDTNYFRLKEMRNHDRLLLAHNTSSLHFRNFCLHKLRWEGVLLLLFHSMPGRNYPKSVNNYDA